MNRLLSLFTAICMLTSIGCQQTSSTFIRNEKTQTVSDGKVVSPVSATDTKTESRSTTVNTTSTKKNPVKKRALDTKKEEITVETTTTTEERVIKKGVVVE
jgi:hypothetical protein